MEFELAEDSNAAKDNMDESELFGRTIRVNHAKPKQLNEASSRAGACMRACVFAKVRACGRAGVRLLRLGKIGGGAFFFFFWGGVPFFSRGLF